MAGAIGQRTIPSAPPSSGMGRTDSSAPNAADADSTSAVGDGSDDSNNAGQNGGASADSLSGRSGEGPGGAGASAAVSARAGGLGAAGEAQGQVRAQGPGQVGQPRPVHEVQPRDTVEKNSGPSGPTGSLPPPQLPASESVWSRGSADDLKTFVNQLQFGYSLLSEPGTLGDIRAHADRLQANPGQSLVGSFFQTTEAQATVSNLSAGLSSTSKAIVDGLPPELHAQAQEYMKQLSDPALAKDPVKMLFMLEAAVDFIICACSQMNNVDGLKNKDLHKLLLEGCESKEKANRGEIDKTMSETSSKTEANRIQKEEQSKHSFWGAIMAVCMIVLAVVMAVLSVVTAGATLAGTVGIICAMVAMTCTIVQQLPALLDGMGIECEGLKKALAGPLGKILTIIQIACIVVSISAALGSAFSGVSKAAVDKAVGELSVAAKEGLKSAVTEVGKEGLTEAAKQGVTEAAKKATEELVAKGVEQAVAETVVNNLIAESVKETMKTAGTQLTAEAVKGVSVAAQAGINAGLQAASTTGLQVAKAGVGMAQGGLNVARGFMQMDQAKLQERLAELSIDVDNLQIQLNKFKLIGDVTRQEKDQLGKDLKDLLTQIQGIIKNMFSSMDAQSQASQTVGHHLAIGA